MIDCYCILQRASVLCFFSSTTWGIFMGSNYAMYSIISSVKRRLASIKKNGEFHMELFVTDTGGDDGWNRTASRWYSISTKQKQMKFLLTSKMLIHSSASELAKKNTAKATYSIQFLFLPKIMPYWILVSKTCSHNPINKTAIMVFKGKCLWAHQLLSSPCTW